MAEISTKTSDIIYGYIKRDLEPSIFDVTWRIGLSFLIGGLLSMFFCGQFGIGFSALAMDWNHAIHAHMGATQCAIVCGSLFSIMPVFFLRAFSSGILFRLIVRQYGWAQVGLILIAGSVLFFGGSFMTELINIGVWSLSAFISFKLAGLILDEISSLLSKLVEV